MDVVSKKELSNVEDGIMGLLLIILSFVGLLAYGSGLTMMGLILYTIFAVTCSVFGVCVFIDSIFYGIEES